MTLLSQCVHYYKFDIENGTQVDSHGANDATVVGATYTAGGHINGGYDFEAGGGGDYMELDNTILFSDSFSINVWVKRESKNEKMQIYATGEDETTHKNAYLGFHNTNTIKGGFHDGTDYQTIESPGTYIDLTSFHMITCVFNNVANNIKLYYDGSLIETKAGVVTTPTVAGDQTSYFGQQIDNDKFFDGIIDEIGIFGLLDDADITALYNAGAGLQYPFGAVGTNIEVNIGDSWKSVDSIKINIGDVWKDVTGAEVNIGDSWKTIF